MLYQPSYPSPYLSDVDGGHVNEFSCYINADGGTAVTAYKYNINGLNGESLYNSPITQIQPMYAGEILTFEVPNTIGIVNGIDYTWDITLYEAKPDIWITYGTVQKGDNTTTQVYLRPNFLIQTDMYLKIGGALRLIRNYDNTSGVATLASALPVTPTVGTGYEIYSNNVTSTEYFFRARTTPSLVMKTVPSIINSKSYTFSATYAQEENVGYKYYEWTVYDQSNNVITRSGQINTGLIEYSFDGFINGNTYGIGLVLENQDGVVLTVQPIWFSVSYDQPQIDNPPTALVNCEQDSIDLIWSPLLINAGEATTETTTAPKYDYIPNEPYIGGSSVRIDKSTNLSWYIGSKQSPVYAPYETTTFINWHTTDDNFSGLIYRQEGEYYSITAISTIAPTTAETGDKYFNSSDNLIYTAISTNVWGSTGEEPKEGVIYRLPSGVKYLWNGTDMEITNYNTPYYEIRYDSPNFVYIISNGDLYISEEIPAYKVEEKWLLQEQKSGYYDSYVWKDDESWDDNKFFQYITQGFITKYWFKFALLPTEVQIFKNEISATTWNDLRVYTWDELRAYTWNQLRYNKI